MTEQGSGLPDHEMRRALRRAALLTSGAGILYGVLSIIAWYLLREGRHGLADSADPEAYYAAGGLLGSELAALYLLPFAAMLFLWFIVALRGWIRGTQQRRNMLISDLQLVSGVVFIAVFLVGAGAVASALIIAQVEDGGISAESLRALAGFGNTLMVVMSVRVGAIFVMATASLGMTTGVLPRWFTLVSYGFGLVLMLTPIVDSALMVAFPVWVITLSVMLLYHLANVPADRIPGFTARYAEQKRAADGSALD